MSSHEITAAVALLQARKKNKKATPKSVWSIETFAVDEILPESFLAHLREKKFF